MTHTAGTALTDPTSARHQLIVRKLDGHITVLQAPGRLQLDDDTMRTLGTLHQLTPPAYAVHHQHHCPTPEGLHDLHLGDHLVIGRPGNRIAYRVTDRIHHEAVHLADRIA